MNESPAALPSSFRDPAGFVFQQGQEIYRLVTTSGQASYDGLMNSGLYETLTKKNQLLSHQEMPAGYQGTAAYKIIKPEPIPFISYPWEWSFSMLQDAALLTLDIARTALGHGMMLKDATPYNIQWQNGALIFIDTLSFEPYSDGRPWIAYRQFCECFLAPLLLMHYKKTSLHQLQLAWPEGIPLQLTRSLLPLKSRFSMLAWMHIHLHAKIAARPAGEGDKKAVIPKQKQLQLLSSLDMLIRSLKLEDKGTTWGDYYTEAGQRNDYLEQKQQLIRTWCTQLTDIKTAIDFGANEGSFSIPLAANGVFTIAADADPVAINKLYKRIRQEKINTLIPLIIDFTHPSPAVGLENKERTSFLERTGRRDLGLCLAFIHHLCIGKNIPLKRVASIMAVSCKQLIIEFVPKSDEKVKLLLASKPDIYTSYDEDGFEKAFGLYFTIEKKETLPGSERILYQLLVK